LKGWDSNPDWEIVEWAEATFLLKGWDSNPDWEIVEWAKATFLLKFWLSFPIGRGKNIVIM